MTQDEARDPEPDHALPVPLEAPGAGGERAAGDAATDDGPAGRRRGAAAAAAAAAAWIARNRDLVEQGRETVQILIPFAPPQARVPLIVASLAAEGLLTLDDHRRGAVPAGRARLRGAGLLLDGIGIVAATASAPPALARQARRIAALRTVVSRLEARAGS
ncbi:MAG: hypothetical protein AAFV86_08530 [Pseudomonadota bacterium]